VGVSAVDGGDPGINGAALLDVLAVQRYVEPFPFLVFVDPQSNGHVDDFEDDVADDEAVNNGPSTAFSCVRTLPATPPSSAVLAKTPVSNAPTMPPMQCTPKASRESSYPSAFFSEVAAEEADDSSGHADDDRSVGITNPKQA